MRTDSIRCHQSGAAHRRSRGSACCRAPPGAAHCGPRETSGGLAVPAPSARGSRCVITLHPGPRDGLRAGGRDPCTWRCGPARGRDHGHPAPGPAAAGRRRPGLPVPGPDDGPADRPARPRGWCRATPAGCWASRATPVPASTTTRWSSTPTWPRAPPAGWPGPRSIGNALLYLQAHDAPTTGGCATGTRRPPCTPRTISRSRTRPAAPATLAWAGQALAQLYAATRIRAYLRGAVALGDWIQAHCRDGRGRGRLHRRLHRGRGRDRVEVDRAQHRRVRVLPAAGPGDRQPGLVAARAAWARRFIVSMWNPAAGRFYLGTTGDGVTRNDSPQVEDVNSWSYLALQDPAYAASVGWDVREPGRGARAVSAG